MRILRGWPGFLLALAAAGAPAAPPATHAAAGALVPLGEVRDALADRFRVDTTPEATDLGLLLGGGPRFRLSLDAGLDYQLAPGVVPGDDHPLRPGLDAQGGPIGDDIRTYRGDWVMTVGLRYRF